MIFINVLYLIILGIPYLVASLLVQDRFRWNFTDSNGFAFLTVIEGFEEFGDIKEQSRRNPSLITISIDLFRYRFVDRCRFVDRHRLEIFIFEVKPDKLLVYKAEDETRLVFSLLTHVLPTRLEYFMRLIRQGLNARSDQCLLYQRGAW